MLEHNINGHDISLTLHRTSIFVMQSCIILVLNAHNAENKKFTTLYFWQVPNKNELLIYNLLLFTQQFKCLSYKL